MSNLSQSQYSTKGESSWIVYLRERMKAIRKSKLNLFHILLLPVAGFVFYAGWYTLSYENGQLFMDKIILSGLIVSMLLFFRASVVSYVPGK